MSSKTFRCYQIFPHPIQLDIQNYDYALKILTVQFSNVVPNVTEKLYVEGHLIADVGCYELNELINNYNALNSYGAMYASFNNGKMIISNVQNTDIVINNSNFLTSNICGNFTLPLTIPANGKVESPNSPKIQDYNYFVLTSPNVNGYTQQSKDGQGFTPNNTLWPFSSAMSPFQFKTWTSLQPVEFKIDNNTLNYMEFELKTADGLSINNQLADSDFMVCAQIVQYKKI